MEVNGYTAERMLSIENGTIVDGDIVGDNLILKRRDLVEINAGNVRGPQGVAGPPGGLGEAPTDGNTYARKSSAWHAISSIPDVPTDGVAYARQNGAWIVAPGSLLGSKFNDTDSVTAINTPVSFAGGGTSLIVPVNGRGVTVEFEGILGHSAANQHVWVCLYVDGGLLPRGKPVGQIANAGGLITLGRMVTFAAGELTAGNHTFEVKAVQATAIASMAMYESQISIRAN